MSVSTFVMNGHAYIYKKLYICTCTLAHTHACMYKCAHTQAHIHMCMHACYSYTHIPSGDLALSCFTWLCPVSSGGGRSGVAQRQVLPAVVPVADPPQELPCGYLHLHRRFLSGPRPSLAPVPHTMQRNPTLLCKHTARPASFFPPLTTSTFCVCVF